ncbi:Transposase [bioreactor metagenome]|uniref:Transposase n=1 Tax=bioreactor metagenome TaxID=1076179 RepID=A0A644ZKE7_9ZZZZ
MGKDLHGKELGKGFSQRRGGMYHARFVDRFGKRKSLYNASLSALKKAYKEEQNKDIARTNVKTEFTLNEWFEQWIKVYKYQLRDSSKLHYTTVYEKHVKPVLGRKLLSKITNLDVIALINDLDRQGYGFETKDKARLILLDMFNKAVVNDFALKNPIRTIRIERNEEIERRVLSRDEQTDFFDACKGTFYDELFTVAVLTGLRPGELFALRWQDIDIANRKISVSRTLLYQKLEGDHKKEFHIDPPKTKSSIRTVRFNERCEIALKSQFRKKSMVALKHCAKPLLDLDDLLFVTKFDTPINSQIFCDAIERIVNLINESRNDLEQFEIFSGHCFRHTYATRCFEAGVDPKVVQKQLGHASLKMTMDLYTHLFEEKKTDELVKFNTYSDDVFGNADALAEARFEAAKHPKVVRL